MLLKKELINIWFQKVYKELFFEFIMADKKEVHSIVAYVFGIVSIVLAFFTPMAGIVFGIIGIVQSKKNKDELSVRAKKLSVIGLILSIILLIVSLVIAIYYAYNTGGFGDLANLA